MADIDQWPPEQHESQVNIWNWFVNWRDPVAEAFQEEYDGIEDFTIDGYNNPSQWYSQIQGNHSIDSVGSISDFTNRMMENDLAEPLPVEHMPNWEQIDEQFREESREQYGQDGEVFGFPDTVILNPSLEYNEEHFDSPPNSWGVLWEEELADDMVMMDRDFIMMQIAALYTGQDPHDPDDWDEIEEVLLQQRDLNRTFYQDHGSAQQLFANEDVLVGPAPAAIAVGTRADLNDSINYTVPDEGSLVTMNQLVVPKGAPNPVAGVMFTDYALSDTSARLHWETGFATTTHKNHDKIIEENSGDFSEDIVEMAQWNDEWDLALRQPLSEEIRQKTSDVYTQIMGA